MDPVLLSPSGLLHFLWVVGLLDLWVAVVRMGLPAGVQEELAGGRNHLPQKLEGNS